MSMRTSHSERAERSVLNDLKMVTLDQFLKSSNKQIFFDWKNISWHACVSSLLSIRYREELLFTPCPKDNKSPV